MRDELRHLATLDASHSFDGDRLLRPGLQAFTLGIACAFDSCFGLSISRVDALPRPLEAVYDCLLKLARVVLSIDAMKTLTATRPGSSSHVENG